MHYFLSVFLVMIVQLTSAQKSSEVSLSFIPYFDSSPILIDADNNDANSESISIEVLRFYISDVTLYNNEELIYTEKVFHLLDVENQSSLSWNLSPTSNDFTHIEFNIGIDSLTNLGGVQGGDLDPMHGMYWAWQSGYINFKLEGTAPQCPARKNRFQYHIGGFLSPYNAIQSLNLSVSNTADISIKVNLDDFFDSIDMKETYEVMSPSETSVELSHVVKNMFSIHI